MDSWKGGRVLDAMVVSYPCNCLSHTCIAGQVPGITHTRGSQKGGRALTFSRFTIQARASCW